MWMLCCGLLSVLATVVSLRRTVVFCGLVLCANVLAHLVADDLGKIPSVAVLGLWEGLPFWTVLFWVSAELMVQHVTGRYVERAVPPPWSLIRVPPWPWREPLALPSMVRPPMRIGYRLTRQKEIFALLIAGYRENEIAAELGITPERVSRQIASAVRRAGAVNKYDLVRMLAAEWWDSGPASRLRDFWPQPPF